MNLRTSLAARISLLAVAVAAITALVAGGIAVNLVRSSGSANARRTLASVADDAAATAAAGNVTLARRSLRAFKIDFGTIGPRGALVTADADARDALTAADVRAVLDGRTISTTRSVDGHTLLVEARPIPGGAQAAGIVVVQRRSDALAGNDRAIRRLLLALLVAAAVALALGLVVARRIARPLRRTAAAAHDLAGGARDVAVPVDGPAEVADVAEALNTLGARLRESEASRREFLLAVSHDLRTPLTAIRGYAESLADGVVAGPETAEVGATVRAEAERLDRLVGDLLDLARLESADLRIDLVEVDPGPFLAEAATVWTARCATAGIAFETDIRPAPVRMRTDPVRLRQVLDGLLENALRVTPAGRPIVLGSRAEPGVVVLEVRDGGPGLRDEDFAVAFERAALYTRYRGERQVGTGLGLAIVHRLVTLLGGTVEAGHAAEGGARFSVRVPAPDPAADPNRI